MTGLPAVTVSSLARKLCRVQTWDSLTDMIHLVDPEWAIVLKVAHNPRFIAGVVVPRGTCTVDAVACVGVLLQHFHQDAMSRVAAVPAAAVREDQFSAQCGQLFEATAAFAAGRPATDGAGSSRVDVVRSELDGVILNTQGAIAAMVHRGAALDRLKSDTAALTIASGQFQHQGATLRRGMWCRNCRTVVAVALAVALGVTALVFVLMFLP